MAAELGQTELFAVVGAEFNSHDVGWWDVDTKKPDRDWPGLRVLLGGVALCRLRRHRDFGGCFFRESEVRRCDPSWGTTKSIKQQIVRELGHGDLAMLAFVIQNGNEEP